MLHVDWLEQLGLYAYNPLLCMSCSASVAHEREGEREREREREIEKEQERLREIVKLRVDWLEQLGLYSYHPPLRISCR